MEKIFHPFLQTRAQGEAPDKTTNEIVKPKNQKKKNETCGKRQQTRKMGQQIKKETKQVQKIPLAHQPFQGDWTQIQNKTEKFALQTQKN